MPLIALFIHFGFQEIHPSPIRFYAFSAYIAVADLREGAGGGAPPLSSRSGSATALLVTLIPLVTVIILEI